MLFVVVVVLCYPYVELELDRLCHLLLLLYYMLFFCLSSYINMLFHFIMITHEAL